MEKVFAKLKYRIKDFVVEEIGERWECEVSENFVGNIKPDLRNLDLSNSKDFLWCEMEKYDIDHFTTIKNVARLLGVNVDAIGYAGTKDKNAWTSQRISIFNPDIEKVKLFSHPNIVLKNFKWNKRKIKMGYLEGNRFEIVVRDVEKKDAMKIVGRIRKMKWFPNYFGLQRFGVKGNNVKIGEFILKRKFEEAVWAVCEDSPRQELFVRNFLEKNPGDFVGAIKRVDKKNMLMYINSVQSKIFNEILEMALGEDLDFTKKGQMSCLLVGYKTRFYNGRLGEIEQEVLASHGLKLEDFNIREISYLRMKGSFRKAVTEVVNLNVEISDDDEFVGLRKIVLEFILPSGVYATTFLENFFRFG